MVPICKQMMVSLRFRRSRSAKDSTSPITVEVDVRNILKDPDGDGFMDRRTSIFGLTSIKTAISRIGRAGDGRV